MKLGLYMDKLIRISLHNGKVFEGVGDYYTSELDNPNGIASICVGDYELYENEIASVEALSESMPFMAKAV